MSKVSIIMPIYNVAEQLGKAIQCALKQTYSNIELILVNDGSTDKSGIICDQYQQKDSRITVVHQKNAGSGYARNAGLDIATGEYIYFADPDDYFEENLIEETVAKAEEANANLVVFGYINETVNKDGEVHKVELLPQLTGKLSKENFREQFRKHYELSPYALWNKLYRHSFLEQHHCRFTNQKVGQDALFNQLVGYDLEDVVYHPKTYYHYVFREGSAVNRYRKERFSYEYNIADHFEKWMQHWKKEEQYADLIHKEYWGALYLELSNLSWKDCPLTTSEKVERIKELMSDSKVHLAVSEYSLEEESNTFVTLLIRLLRKERYLSALRVMHLRVVVGKKFQTSFKWIKEKFS